MLVERPRATAGAGLAALLLIAGLGATASHAEAAEPALLWQIGAPDGTTAEFALAPGDAEGSYKTAFALDPVYVVGQSKPAQDWPCAQPGPADVWAGARSHTFTILFYLKQVPPAGSGTLYLDFVDTHSQAPPRLAVTLNASALTMPEIPRGAGDDSIRGQPERGRKHTAKVAFSAESLHAGRNELRLISESGSWVLYDAVRMMAPEGATLAEAPTTIVMAAPVDGCLYGPENAPEQHVRLTVTHTGTATAAVVRVEGREALQTQLTPGRQTLEIKLPAVDKSRDVRVALAAGEQVLGEEMVAMRPARKWCVYLLPHSHNDIGYTDLQPNIEKKQMANIARAIELARATADYPEGARFKWNVEVLWAVDSYLRQGPEKERELVEAVQKGWIGLDALYANLLTGLCRAEETLRAVRCATQLAERCGVAVDAAMISDVPGMTWGMVPAFAHAGVKYLSDGVNQFDRIGTSLSAWEDKPFWWVSCSGQERVLVWTPYKGYSLAHDWLNFKLERDLPGVLAGLEARGYPYEITCLRWSVGGDNGPPDEKLADRVREWNAAHTYPRLIIATTSTAFRALEQRYGAQLPEFRGDFTPYWEDGAASTALETAASRNAADRLVQAETLFALRKPGEFPAADFAGAWRNVLLYTEHTWGAHNSISEPNLPFVQDQWRIKQAFAVDADRQSRELVQQALADAKPAANAAGAVDVYNTNSWARTDLVCVPRELAGVGTRVTDATGTAVASQRLANGELVFVAGDVPPFAARRYQIGAGEAAGPAQAARAGGLELDNGLLHVKVDAQSGAIVELRAGANGPNLVARGAEVALNDYLYLPGSDLKNLQRCGETTVTVGERGPLVGSLRIESAAPGCRRLVREVRLIAGLDRVEIADTVDKLPIRDKEGVHFGFAFDVPQGQVRIDVPWAVVRPEQDQIPGSCKNWFSAQRWVDISNAERGVTWVTLDAPLVEVGGVTANLIGGLSNSPLWRPHVEPTQTIYAWVMNNHWHTNYRADQDGPTTFRFVLRPHGAYSPVDNARAAVACSQPLIAAPASDTAPRAPRVTVEPAEVLATALKPSDDGGALVLRLFGASGEERTATVRWAQPQPQTVYLSNVSERPQQRVDRTVRVPGWGIVTLRAETGAATVQRGVR